jgi:hypothetical protein
MRDLERGGESVHGCQLLPAVGRTRRRVAGSGVVVPLAVGAAGEEPVLGPIQLALGEGEAEAAQAEAAE